MNDQIDKETKAAVLAGALPADLIWAKSRLSQKEFIGWCQAFVNRATGGLTQGASAIEAFNNAQNKVIGNLNGIKPGDLIYFNPDQSNQGFGHAGIYEGNNKFISATDNGIAESDLGDWGKTTGQSIAGFVPNPNSTGPSENVNIPANIPAPTNAGLPAIPKQEPIQYSKTGEPTGLMPAIPQAL